jgi:hypothetical protein
MLNPTYCPFAYSVLCCRKRNGSGSFGGAYESEEEIAYVGLGVNVYVFQFSTVKMCCFFCSVADPDLNPLVRGTDFYEFLSLKNNVNVSKKIRKNLIFCCHLEGH